MYAHCFIAYTQLVMHVFIYIACTAKKMLHMIGTKTLAFGIPIIPIVNIDGVVTGVGIKAN